MHTKNETRKLGSAFVIATLAFNFLAPQPLGVSSATDELVFGEVVFGQSLGTDMLLQSEFEALDPPSQFEDGYIRPILVGHTSFIAPKSPQNPPGKKIVVLSTRWLFVTAYSSTPDQTDSTPFITASGSHVRDGIVAANFLRFGTKVRFPTLYGDKIFIVEDRMNSRYEYRLDIWMETREEAKQFGIKAVPIETIKEI